MATRSKVRDYLTPEALTRFGTDATQGGVGDDLKSWLEMTVPDFVGSYQTAARAGNDPASNQSPNAHLIKRRQALGMSIGGLLGLPSDSTGLFTTPGEGWIPRIDQESGQIQPTRRFPNESGPIDQFAPEPQTAQPVSPVNALLKSLKMLPAQARRAAPASPITTISGPMGQPAMKSRMPAAPSGRSWLEAAPQPAYAQVNNPVSRMLSEYASSMENSTVKRRSRNRRRGFLG